MRRLQVSCRARCKSILRGATFWRGHAVRRTRAAYAYVCCISASAHRYYMHRCMHSGFGFLALPRTRPPIEEVANELSSRWLALDRIDDLIKEVPAHFLAQTPAE